MSSVAAADSRTSAPLKPVRSATIVGAGVIGSGWAARLLARGVQVRVWDPNPESFVSSRRAVERAWPALVARGIAAQAEPMAAQYCESLVDACVDAQWVQESAPENAEAITQSSSSSGSS